MTGRWKGTKEEDEWSEETLLKLARLFAGLQFLAGGEGEKPLGVGEKSWRGVACST